MKCLKTRGRKYCLYIFENLIQDDRTVPLSYSYSEYEKEKMIVSRYLKEYFSENTEIERYFIEVWSEKLSI